MDIRPFIFLALLSVLGTAEKIRYDDYSVISVNIENEQQHKFVEQLDASTDEIQLLETVKVNKKAVLIIPPHIIDKIEKKFSSEGWVYRVETTNLQK